MEHRLVERLFTELRGSGRPQMRNALTIASYLFLLKFLEASAPELAREAGVGPVWDQIVERAGLQAEEGLRLLVQEGTRRLESAYHSPHMDGAHRALSSIPTHDLVPVLEAVGALWEQPGSERKKAPAEIFEQVIAHAAKEGAASPSLGQFLTPPHFARIMVDLVRPGAGDRVVDLGAGTCHLLLAAYSALSSQSAPEPGLGLRFRGDGFVYADQNERAGESFALAGYEIDPTLALLGFTHLRLTGLCSPEIECCDVLGGDFEERIARGEIPQADTLLANPPFGPLVNRRYLGEQLQSIDTELTEVLFFERSLTLLKDGGRAAVLVPDGLLRNSTRAARSLRERLMGENQVRAIISLPAGVFLPHTNIKTSLVVFVRGGRTSSPVWCYRVSRDGFALTARRTEQPQDSDLWDLRVQYAIANELPAPIRVPGLQSGEDWRRFREEHPDLAGSGYVAPLIEKQIERSGRGKRVRYEHTAYIAAVEVRERDRPTTWYASPDEIAAQGYNLCADTYAPYVEPKEEQIDVASLAREIKELEQQRREADRKLAAMLSQLYPDLREAIEAAYLPKREESDSLDTGGH